MNKIIITVAALTLVGLVACSRAPKLCKESPVSNYETWEIKDGKFYQDGKWYFLKIGKPLIPFCDSAAVHNLMTHLPTIKKLGYNVIELNCYWYQFDVDGDGVPDKEVKPLRELVDTIYAMGMYPALSVETYAVGGGGIPDGFWEKYPESVAVDPQGNPVCDTEYGTNRKVVSIFHEEYRKTAHEYIKNLARGIDTRKILWFETTVEPQYMGAIPLCYSENARKEYNKWRESNNITDEASQMPETFPIPQSFIENPTWNKFRAQFLAEWINADAAAFREVAGQDKYVAVDYLDANESEQYLRDGDPLEFLRYLTCPDIIQVNWSWDFNAGEPNRKAYDRVYSIMKETGRNWAVTEHMTFNGSDFHWPEDRLNALLENTLQSGTRFGWEFVSLLPGTDYYFDVYNDDWSPKETIASVDNHWEEWLDRVQEIETEKHR